MPDQSPPGWYVHPSEPDGQTLRWWDGKEWTDPVINQAQETDLAKGSVPDDASELPAVLQPAPLTHSNLVWETRFMMVAFLLPAILDATVALAQTTNGEGGITQFPVLLSHSPLANMALGIVSYLNVAATVPLALYLLTRTGQTPSKLLLGMPNITRDVFPGIAIAAASFGTELLLLVPFLPLLDRFPSLLSKVDHQIVPHYYVVWGLATSLTTAIAEEVLMNGYLISRLDQLGWSPRRALFLAMILRTSYHIYYGIGFIFTIPFSYYATRSFQKRRILNRPIAAHFFFDAVLTTIVILR